MKVRSVSSRVLQDLNAAIDFANNHPQLHNMVNQSTSAENTKRSCGLKRQSVEQTDSLLLIQLCYRISKPGGVLMQRS